MHVSTLPSIDLLRAFDALFTEQHLTRAAARLGLTQPAMSHSLRRLRAAFGDPLFVRSPRGMVPTPRAQALAEPISRILVDLALLAEPPNDRFDPAELERTFCIATTDYGEVALLPGLLASLTARAPRASIVCKPVPDALEASLESGEIDVAVGVFQNLSPRLLQQRIHEERFRCVMRGDHPLRRRRIDAATYARLPHMLIAPRGDLGGVVDAALAARGLERRVVLRVSHFLVAPVLAAHSDLVLTAPARVIDAVAGAHDLFIFDPPVEVPGFSVVQVWHERHQHEPGHAWLRERIAEATRPAPRAPTRTAK